MEAAFRAVHLSIRSLQIKLSAQCVDFPSPAEQVVNSLCQQCEASLQFLQSLCQQKMFRERLLKNKVRFRTLLSYISQMKWIVRRSTFCVLYVMLTF